MIPTLKLLHCDINTKEAYTRIVVKITNENQLKNNNL